MTGLAEKYKKVEKIVVNTGFGKQIGGKSSEEQKKIIEEVMHMLAAICGQRPALTKARISIAPFKLRKGMPIGAKVTLRGSRMQGFLEKIINIALPRSRDFRGIDETAVDQMGNLTLGIAEHIFFPEILPENVRYPFGLEVTFVSTAKTREEALELFRSLGFRFKR